jgi:hypothetical protein
MKLVLLINKICLRPTLSTDLFSLRVFMVNDVFFAGAKGSMFEK